MNPPVGIWVSLACLVWY